MIDSVKTGASGSMKYIIWFLVSVLIWTWIFGRITDADAENKVVLYADAESVDSGTLETLAAELLPGGIKFFKARTLSYAVFDETELAAADMYILTEDTLGDYMPSLLPLTAYAAVHPEQLYYTVDGVPYGICVFDPGSELSAGGEYITYGSKRAWLFFNSASLHAGDLNSSADNAAIIIAEAFFGIE